MRLSHAEQEKLGAWPRKLKTGTALPPKYFPRLATNLASAIFASWIGPHRGSWRWITGVFYGLIYVVVAAFGATIVALFAAFPAVVIKAIAGLGLIGSLTGALAGAMQDEKNRFAAVLTFVITASGVTLLGISAAFWGLVAGLIVIALDRAVRQSSV